ncbi:MAG: ABC transporter permease, partial [Desulfovibrio sp.]
MNPLRLVFAEARKGMWSLLALALLLGLSIGSGVCITSVEKAVRAGAARAGDDFDLIIGAQGSATDLVLSGVYLRENTLKLIPGELLSGIRRSKGTAWVAPLAFGDRWGRYPVVGTSADLVTLGGKRGVAEGRLFTRPGEA